MLQYQKIIIIGIVIVVAALSVLALSINNLDKPVSKPLQDPGLLILSEDHKTAKMIVSQVIKKYDKEGKDLSALENQLDFNVNSKLKRYAFVIDYETQKIVAHPNSELIGQNSFALINSSESEESILENLKNNESHWVYYNFTNPETENVEPKTSWFKLHDGLIFGSGFYN
jgi:signal transduction histidine kinase